MARAKALSNNAVEILQKRYLKDDSKRTASVETERLSAEIARMIYKARKEARLSQRELAELIGTTQSVISRLEDSDYEGHSLPMLERIASALNKRIRISFLKSS
jgi:ribosome-binding protein aMBF1 (putative translation factor)